MKVLILGSNSAIPTANRFPTAQLLDVNHAYYLIDCGEGAQMQLRRNHIKMQRIRCIFISHMHGDHYFGLIGLLNTMHLLGREIPLSVYGPPELEPIIRSMMHAAHSKLRYELNFHTMEFGTREEVYVDEHVKVTSLPMDHRIPCNGFLFEETPRKLKVKKEAIKEFEISLKQIPNLKDGEDLVLEDGSRIPNALVTETPNPLKKYAFCSDTRYNERLIDWVDGVDILYHEATFAQDMEKRARETYHATTTQAATIAMKAGVRKLVIGHFSARYAELEPHLLEARQTFKETYLAEEGIQFVC